MKKQAQKYLNQLLPAAMGLANLPNRWESVDPDFKESVGVATKTLIYTYQTKRSLRRALSLPAKLRNGDDISKKDLSAVLNLLVIGSYLIAGSVEIARADIDKGLAAKARYAQKQKVQRQTASTTRRPPSFDDLKDELSDLGIDVSKAQNIGDLFKTVFDPAASAFNTTDKP